jgi:hypothetical protein
MKSSFIFAVLVAATACRIEKVKSGDSATLGAQPGPGVQACGISTGSRVTEDGLGLLRIGASIDAIRANCSVLSESQGTTTSMTRARVDLSEDTAAVEFENGLLVRITLYHQAYRTADSLGVGTHVSRLIRLRDAVGVTDRKRLYLITPAFCGLRFMLAEPAPLPPAAQSGRAALRRLSGETRTRELEIVGCSRRG